MRRPGRFMRWMMVVGTGVMPAFILQCDKAALNFQRAFYGELGVITANWLVDADFLGAAGAG